MIALTVMKHYGAKCLGDLIVLPGQGSAGVGLGGDGYNAVVYKDNSFIVAGMDTGIVVSGVKPSGVDAYDFMRDMAKVVK